MKKYVDFMNEISADELYKGLLAYGFFPEKILPIFTAEPFFNYCENLTKSFENKWADYISLRVMRNVNIPRLMGIPNPFKYQKVCAELRDNWDEICNHFNECTADNDYRVIRIHIRKQSDSNRIFKMNYKNWYLDGNPELDLLIQKNETNRYLVKADISTCFPSIYTHSIPWAIVGKQQSKKTINNETLWYNKLDRVCSEMRNGETHGLLIGPHASNVISEIILTKIDKCLYKKGYRYIRNIDDYDCYVSSYDAAQRFLRDLEEELREFDLPMNHKKTAIIQLPIGIEKNWKHQLSSLPKEGKSGFIEYPQLNSFIDISIDLAKELGNFAIVNYAIKKVAGLNLTNNAKRLAAKRFIHLVSVYPYLLHLAEEYIFQPFEVDIQSIKALSETIFTEGRAQNNYESMSYAIYFAIRYNFTLFPFDTNYEEETDFIVNSKDCLLLIVTWIYFAKQNHWKQRATELKKFNKLAKNLKKMDMNRHWLFCYEVLSKGNLDGEWSQMKNANVSFIREDLKNTRE